MNATVFTLKGKFNRHDVFSDAYREAVLGGYEGTQDQWIASIKARIAAGEKVNCKEFNALLDHNRSNRYMARE